MEGPGARCEHDITEALVSTYEIAVNGETFVVEVGDVTTSPVTVSVNGEAKSVAFREITASAPAAIPVVAAKPAPVAQAAPIAKPAPVGTAKGEIIKAPMPGKILSVRVQVGTKIKEGDTVCTLEAMKMEMPIAATAAGTVQAIHISVGTNVAFDDPLVTVA